MYIYISLSFQTDIRTKETERGNTRLYSNVAVAKPKPNREKQNKTGERYDTDLASPLLSFFLSFQKALKMGQTTQHTAFFSAWEDVCTL